MGVTAVHSGSPLVRPDEDQIGRDVGEDGVSEAARQHGGAWLAGGAVGGRLTDWAGKTVRQARLTAVTRSAFPAAPTVTLHCTVHTAASSTNLSATNTVYPSVVTLLVLVLLSGPGKVSSLLLGWSYRKFRPFVVYFLHGAVQGKQVSDGQGHRGCPAHPSYSDGLGFGKHNVFVFQWIFCDILIKAEYKVNMSANCFEGPK